jgi:hypothetical protein
MAKVVILIEGDRGKKFIFVFNIIKSYNKFLLKNKIFLVCQLFKEKKKNLF